MKTKPRSVGWLGSRSKMSVLGLKLGAWSLVILFGILYVLPLGSWVGLVLDERSFDMNWPLFSSVAWRTLWLSALSSLLCLAGALPLALLWRLGGRAERTTMLAAMGIPLIMGFLARNWSWIGLLTSKKRWQSFGTQLVGLDQWLYTHVSVVVVMSFVFVPIAFFILVQRLRSLTQIQIDAARTLGLSDFRIILGLLLPVSIRACVHSGTIVFALATTFFITPQMLGGGRCDFITNLLLSKLNDGDFSTASIIGLTFLILVTICMVPLVYAGVKLGHGSAR